MKVILTLAFLFASLIASAAQFTIVRVDIAPSASSCFGKTKQERPFADSRS